MHTYAFLLHFIISGSCSIPPYLVSSYLVCINFINRQMQSIELKRRRPIQLLQPSIRLNRGLFSLNGLVAHLRTLLPKDFSQLQKPLGVCVCVCVPRAFSCCCFSGCLCIKNYAAVLPLLMPILHYSRRCI